jgi:hypothetical protein
MKSKLRSMHGFLLDNEHWTRKRLYVFHNSKACEIYDTIEHGLYFRFARLLDELSKSLDFHWYGKRR